jgi:hypothetical protein
VLVFVGLKMVWLDPWYGGKFPVAASRLIIASIIGVSVALSLRVPRRAPSRAVARSEEA